MSEDDIFLLVEFNNIISKKSYLLMIVTKGTPEHPHTNSMVIHLLPIKIHFFKLIIYKNKST